MVACYKCGRKLAFTSELPPGRGDHCPQCTTDLRSCKMCQFYDSASYNECREPVAERVKEKEKANFCDYFKFGPAGSSSNANSKEDLLKAAAALFKK